MRFPHDNFTITSLDAWMRLTLPLAIEMTDHQYSQLVSLLGANVKDYKGIPIHFVDAPKLA